MFVHKIQPSVTVVTGHTRKHRKTQTTRGSHRQIRHSDRLHVSADLQTSPVSIQHWHSSHY